jgi:hypothetical protein
MLQYGNFRDVVYQRTLITLTPRVSSSQHYITSSGPAQRLWKYTCLHDLSARDTKCPLVATST